MPVAPVADQVPRAGYFQVGRIRAICPAAAGTIASLEGAPAHTPPGVMTDEHQRRDVLGSVMDSVVEWLHSSRSAFAHGGQVLLVGKGRNLRFERRAVGGRERQPL